MSELVGNPEDRFSHDATEMLLDLNHSACSHCQKMKKSKRYDVKKQKQYEPHHEKPMFCICENKDADQLRGNREADQRLCFRYIDTTIPLLSKTIISCLLPYSVTAQPGLCRTRSETPKTGFLATRLKYKAAGSKTVQLF